MPGQDKLFSSFVVGFLFLVDRIWTQASRDKRLVHSTGVFTLKEGRLLLRVTNPSSTNKSSTIEMTQLEYRPQYLKFLNPCAVSLKSNFLKLYFVYTLFPCYILHELHNFLTCIRDSSLIHALDISQFFEL